jgi:NADPH-dependent curcumin reductase CurA
MLKPGEVMRAVALGIVEASRHADRPVGELVQGLWGCQERAVVDGTQLLPLAPIAPLPLTAHFSLLGHIGMTAYCGLVKIGQPRAGETLVVSAAAGAVGSLVGQIGRILGCRVVGIAGGADKCRYLTETLGFDAAVTTGATISPPRSQKPVRRASTCTSRTSAAARWSWCWT